MRDRPWLVNKLHLDHELIAEYIGIPISAPTAGGKKRIRKIRNCLFFPVRNIPRSWWWFGNIAIFLENLLILPSLTIPNTWNISIETKYQCIEKILPTGYRNPDWTMQYFNELIPFEGCGFQAHIQPKPQRGPIEFKLSRSEPECPFQYPGDLLCMQIVQTKDVVQYTSW